MEQEINRNLRRLRRQKGLTQERLAGAVGVSAQAVSKWEQNGYPDTPLLPAIADSLGVSIDELFGRNREETPDIFNQLMQYLSSFPYEERLNRAFDLCWAICETGYGITHYIPLECPENFDASRSDEYKYSETVTEYGFLQAKADPSLLYFTEQTLAHGLSIELSHALLDRPCYYHYQSNNRPFPFSAMKLIEILGIRAKRAHHNRRTLSKSHSLESCRYGRKEQKSATYMVSTIS